MGVHRLTSGIAVALAATVCLPGCSAKKPADATAMVWTHSSAPEDLASAVAAHPQLDWVQLPWAGIEPYLEVLDPGRQRVRSATFARR